MVLSDWIGCRRLLAIAWMVAMASTAHPQTPDPVRIRVLFFDTPEDRAPMLEALREGLPARGYPDNAVHLDVRYAMRSPTELTKAARELAFHPGKHLAGHGQCWLLDHG